MLANEIIYFKLQEEPKAQELPPLPAYQTMGAECLSSSETPKFTMASPPTMTLPTYDQSEKFVEGVAHTGTTMESEDESETQSQGQGDGSCYEFAMFFVGMLVCA